MNSLTKRALLGPKIPSCQVTMKITNLPPVQYFTKLEIPKQEILVGKEDHFKDYSILKATSLNHNIYIYTYVYIINWLIAFCKEAIKPPATPNNSKDASKKTKKSSSSVLGGRSFLQGSTFSTARNVGLPDMTKLLEDRKHGISSALEPWSALMVVLVVLVVIMVTGDTVFFPGLVGGEWQVFCVCGSCIIYVYIFFYDLWIWLDM